MTRTTQELIDWLNGAPIVDEPAAAELANALRQLQLDNDRLRACFRDLNTKINGFIYEVLECPPTTP